MSQVKDDLFRVTDMEKTIEKVARAICTACDDDGDCARMEAQLGIDVIWYDKKVWCCVGEEVHAAEYYEHHNEDKNAARRAASCRVAEEIGRRMR